jgi:hypothetical protein
MLDLSQGINNVTWPKVHIQAGKTPSRRYGHTVVFNDPFLILYGGIKEDRQPTHDLWVIDLKNKPFFWTPINLDLVMEKPSPRAYHSASLCQHNDVVYLFGGRGADD